MRANVTKRDGHYRITSTTSHRMVNRTRTRVTVLTEDDASRAARARRTGTHTTRVAPEPHRSHGALLALIDRYIATADAYGLDATNVVASYRRHTDNGHGFVPAAVEVTTTETWGRKG